MIMNDCIVSFNVNERKKKPFGQHFLILLHITRFLFEGPSVITLASL